MNKLFVCIIFCLLFVPVCLAGNMQISKYKFIENKESISYNPTNSIWSKKVDKKNDFYFTKTKGFGNYYDYLDSNKNFAFTTDCEYEFISDGNLIGYSNNNLKFYKITLSDGIISKEPLLIDEVKKIFPEFEVVGLSEFSSKTNSIKLKKNLTDLKLIVYNDFEDKVFLNYEFASGNSNIETYPLSGFIKISKPGMIQFSGQGERSDDNPWYVILVR